MDEEISDSSNRSRSARPSGHETPSSPGIPQARGRARGRCRGSGRRGGGERRPGNRVRNAGGRGRRGRVVFGPQLPNRAELAAIAREERDVQLRDRISQLSEDRLRGVVERLCQRDPSLVFQVVNESSEEQRDGYHPPADAAWPTWCVCQKCREMPSEEEKMCCGQIPIDCLSTLPDFDLIVLDPLVLVVAQRYRQDVMTAAPDNDFNCGKRHAAYRQFILWQHGYHGAGNRRVIPSCCVWKIRDRYPDSFWTIQGFCGW